jgi:hypothetical protein
LKGKCGSVFGVTTNGSAAAQHRNRASGFAAAAGP